MIQVNEGIAIYQVGCFVLLTYHPTKPCNFNVAVNQLKVLQLN
jgi:hypothetical protein